MWRGDVELDLTKTEFDLLELLVRNAGIVLDHSTIYERIWNYDFGPDSKNLAVYIGYLRRKTEAGGQDRLIHTVRGVGYVARTEQHQWHRRVGGRAPRPGDESALEDRHRRRRDGGARHAGGRRCSATGSPATGCTPRSTSR